MTSIRRTAAPTSTRVPSASGPSVAQPKAAAASTAADRYADSFEGASSPASTSSAGSAQSDEVLSQFDQFVKDQAKFLPAWQQDELRKELGDKLKGLDLSDPAKAKDQIDQLLQVAENKAAGSSTFIKMFVDQIFEQLTQKLGHPD